MDLYRRTPIKSVSNKSSKSGKSWDASTHNGLSPIQFGFLKSYLDKNF